MADIVQKISTHVVEDSGADFRNNTSFGLPGYGTGRAKFMDTDYYVDIHVYDDRTVQARLHGNFHGDSVLNGSYPSILLVNPNSWSWSYANNRPVIPASAKQVAYNPDIIVGSGVEGSGSSTYDWTFDSGWVAIGNLSDFHGSDEGQDGYLYVSGTATYRVDDPVYPVPVRIPIPGFLKYLGYYPWCRYQDGAFKSCNRVGGRLAAHKGSTWSDILNNDRNHSLDQAHYYSGGQWVRAPKIGAGAQ